MSLYKNFSLMLILFTACLFISACNEAKPPAIDTFFHTEGLVPDAAIVDIEQIETSVDLAQNDLVAPPIDGQPQEQPQTPVDSAYPEAALDGPQDTLSPDQGIDATSVVEAGTDTITPTPDISTTAPCSITPSDNFISSGPIGGPFTPASKTYTLANHGTTSAIYTVAVLAIGNWFTVAPVTGSIPAGGSAPVTISINANANSLPVGTHTSTVTFIIGSCTEIRNILLTVNPSSTTLTDGSSSGLVDARVDSGSGITPTPTADARSEISVTPVP